MGEFRLKNAKGLFVTTMAEGVMTETTLRHLRDAYLPGVPDEKERAECSAALDLIEQLPVANVWMKISPVDPGYVSAHDKNHHSYINHHWVQGHGWFRPGGAKSASEGDGICAGTPKEAGWETMPQIAKALPAINKMLAALGADRLDAALLPTPASLKKASSTLVFEAIDAESELAQCQGFALFVGDGYVDSKGRAGPLARSRMFESAEAGARTARSQGWGDWKVVEVGLRVVAQCDLSGDTPQPALAGVIARLEAETLAKALEEAGVDRLKAKLAELSAAAASEDPKEAAPARPKGRL